MIIDNDLYEKSEIVFFNNNELKIIEGDHNNISFPIDHEKISKV